MEEGFHGVREWDRETTACSGVGTGGQGSREDMGWFRTKGDETWDQFNLCHPSTSVGVVETILDPLGVTQSVDVM